MRSRSVSLVALLPVVALLLTAGCGGGSTDISKTGTPKEQSGSGGSGGGSGRDDFDPKVCDVIESPDLPEDFAAMIPGRFGGALGVVMQFTSAMDAADDETSPDAVRELADALSADDVGDDLVDLSAALEEECGRSEGTDAFRYLGEASTLVAVPKDAGYCKLLEGVFQAGGETSESLLGSIESQAPEEHRDAIRAINELGQNGEPADDAAVAELGSAFFGIGLYAEGRCGIEGGFAQMLLGAAFVGMSGDSGSEGDGDADGSGGETGAEPAPADPAAASAAAPAGSGVAFEVARLDLEDDGEYLASVVVPSGWEQSDMIGISFDPPSGSSFSLFSTMEFKAGCDGMCTATDWEARLRGPDGYLTQNLQNWTVAEERVPAGSEGVVIRGTQDDGSALVLVIRWDDDADRYFQCDVELDEQDADLASAMLAACEAARPGWIPVS